MQALEAVENALGAAIADVHRGALPRRQFIAQLAAAGVGAPLANLLLQGAAAAQPASAVYKPTKRGGGGTLKVLMWQGPTLLNPHFATGVKDQEGSRPFYESLARYDAEGRLVPVLAATVPSRDNGGVARDGLSVTWKLKPGVSWHDGKPFTADDVVFNFQYATDPAAAAYTVGQYLGIKAAEKIDALTVRYVFAQPNPQWDTAAQLQLIPRHLFAAYSGGKSRDAPANLKPVGTGPYRFVDFKPGDLIVGELNPNYHLPNRPHFDRLEIKGGGDAVSAARAVLQTGEYDFAWNVLVEDEVLKRMESAGKGRVAVTPGGNTEFIELNAADPNAVTDGERAHPRSRHPLLSDPAVRKALMLLVDQRAVQQYVYGRTGVVTANVLNNPAPFNSTNLTLDTSVDKANALLDGAGWKRSAGPDSVRIKDGRKLQLVFQTSINAVRQKVQVIVKQNVAKAGIELELKAVSPAVFFSSDMANPDTFGHFQTDLQMYAFTRTPDPSRFMQSFVSWEASSKANKWLGLNRGRWVNDEYDKAYRASEFELDPVKRAALFIRMNDLVCSDGHVIPIVFRPSIAAVARGLNVTLSDWDATLSAIHDWYRES